MHRLINLRRSILIKIIPLAVRLTGEEVPPIASVVTIIEKDDKILAIDLNYKKGLSLPGGGLKSGESFEEGLRREVKEETNLEVKKLVYFSSKPSVKGRFAQVSACFMAEVQSLSDLKSSDEGNVIWVSPEELIKNAAYPDVRKHIQEYKKRSS
jgi:8-oxo-dGTP diphosphatase